MRQGGPAVRAHVPESGLWGLLTMTTLTHQGYIAEVTVDAEAGVIHGEVTNARAVLTFSAKSAADVRAAFEETIADYLDWCRERGVPPEKPYSGTLSLRMDPALHRAAAERAAAYQMSLNQWIVRNISCELGQRPSAISHVDLERRLAGVRDDVVRVLRTETIIGASDPPLADTWSSPSLGRVLQ